MFLQPIRGSVGCHGKFTRPQRWSKKCTVANVCIDFYLTWCLHWNTTELYSAAWWEVWELARRMDPLGEGFGLFLLSRRPKPASYHGNCPLITHLSDILGTPSVWPLSVTIMCECVCCVWLSVCLPLCLPWLPHSGKHSLVFIDVQVNWLARSTRNSFLKQESQIFSSCLFTVVIVSYFFSVL